MSPLGAAASVSLYVRSESDVDEDSWITFSDGKELLVLRFINGPFPLAHTSGQFGSCSQNTGYPDRTLQQVPYLVAEMADPSKQIARSNVSNSTYTYLPYLDGVSQIIFLAIQDQDSSPHLEERNFLSLEGSCRAGDWLGWFDWSMVVGFSGEHALLQYDEQQKQDFEWILFFACQVVDYHLGKPSIRNEERSYFLL
ncbi:hypothetical protein Tco_1172777 [Tanacetum coccineum]